MRRLISTCLVSLIPLGIFASPALANRAHIYEKAFGSKGSAAGELELAAPGFSALGEEISGGSGVAVDDATGDVYVADTGNHRVDEFSSTGVFLRAWGFGVADGASEVLQVCQATCFKGLSGAKAGELESPTFIAVDNSPGESAGDVYVGDAGDDVVSKFSSEGSLIGTWGDGGALATPDGQLVGGCEAEESPPCALSKVVPFGSPLLGITVDAEGDLWVYDSSTMFEFGQGANPIRRWGTRPDGIPSGIAIDGTDNPYVPVALQGGNLTKYTSGGTELGSLFKEGGITRTGVAVNGSSSGLFVDAGGVVEVLGLPCEPFGGGAPATCKVAESFGSPQLAGGAGLAVGPGGESEPVYAADTTADTVRVFVLEPLAAPTVASLTVSDVTGESATLQGELDPRGLAGEAFFEYGKCASASTCSSSGYEHSSAPAGFAGEFAVLAVPGVPVQGLSPGTVYHLRLRAHNTEGEGTREAVFTTQAAGAFSLIDGRQWEMVSPPAKQGALIIGLEQEPPGVSQAAAPGGAITYLADAATEPSPAGFQNLQQVLSTRGGVGASSWASRDLGLPHTSATGASIGYGQEYRFFSEDLSHAVLQPFGSFVPLSDEASESTSYLDDLSCTSNVPTAAYGAGSCFRPLVTAKAGFSDDTATPFEPFDGANEGAASANKCPPDPICGPRFEGASPDAAHIAVSSGVPLTSPAPPPGEHGLYEWSAGALSLISELPGHGGDIGGALGYQKAQLGSDARHAISNDGSRVFWSAVNRHLYLRDVGRGETLQLDLPQGGSGEGPARPVFQDASDDGSRVWFTDIQQLTPGSGARELHPDLYECQIPLAGKLRCALSDLTPLNGAKEPASVQGFIAGASEETCDEATGAECNVYFVADGVLAPGAVAGRCNQSEYKPEAQCDLYLSHDSEPPRLVAVISGEDRADWGQEGSELGKLLARVSPDGRWLAFMSDRNLTGYDTRDALTGKPTEEAYVYDAQSGRLACASCEPTGARPTGREIVRSTIAKAAENAPLVDGNDAWETGTTLAASVPGWVPYYIGYALYQPRFLSDSGRLFFDSYDGLVPKDVNGQWDVYEYQPEGVGSAGAPCGPASGAGSGSVVYKPGHAFEVEGVKGQEGAGCVGLISSGESPDESAFMDASLSGGDVFFLTTAKLAAQDFDKAYDIYDAHECTSLAPCFPERGSQPPECTTADACRAAPAPEPGIYGAPSSATFNGLGNITPAGPVKKVTKKTVKCKRHFVKNRRGKCVRVKAKKKRRGKK